MPIQGSIEEAGLPDVLQLLSLGRKTGCLTVVDGETRGEVYLDIGRVSFATVANRRDRLGDILVKSGRITREQLSEAVEQQSRSSGRQLGRILVDSGRIDRGELEQFVRLQVEEAVYFLFTWKQGEFTFTSDRRPPHQSLLVSLDPESLLLEGARRVDEWSLIQKKIPSFDLVYRRVRNKPGGAADGELTDEQQRVLPLLDGTRDVTGLVDATGMNEFDVGKALYGLVMAGFAQLVERRAHVRHLDYRELLAYVVREAEFADAQRRKDAGRHIVDCPTCAERLRTIHVRRTEGSPALAAAQPVSVAQPEAAARAPQPEAAARAPQPKAAVRAPQPEAAARAPQLAPPAVHHAAAQTPEVMEQRARDRRTGRDRRQFDRRAGLDRRGEVNAAWAQSNGERRTGPRREDDRRPGRARDRRGGDVQRRGGAVEPAATLARPAGPGERITGPRQLQPLEARGERRPHVAAPASVEETTVETTQVAAKAATPQVSAKAAASTPPVTAKAAASTPAAGRTASPSRDIEWIVSPEESLGMIRASQVQLRAPAKPAAAPAVKPGSDVRPPEPNERSPAASSVVAGGAVPLAALPALGQIRPGTEEARLAESWRRAGRKTFPGRALALAATIAGVALLGYMAGHLGDSGRPGQVAETTATNALPATAAAQPPPRTRAPLREPPRASPPVPAQPTPRATASAQPGEPPQRAATTGVQPPPRPAAEPRTAGQDPVQRVAPGPVVAAAQPPTAQPVAPRIETPPPPPAPTVGTIRGVVRDASGRTLPGAQVSVRGTALTAVTDGSGAFEIRGVPDGPAVVQAAATGYVPGSSEVRATAGATVAADLALRTQPTATEPDRVLASGGWAPVDRAEATGLLGGTLGAIEGLGIESIAKSLTGSRPRVRVVQIAESGERIELTETLAGAAVRGGAGPARLTALRIIPASEAYPQSTGTASFGSLLITVKSTLAAEALRSLLERLGEVR